MAPNERLAALSAAGVSIWLDDLSRERLTSGNLQELITDKSVVGVTTNPTIFAAALANGQAYDAQVRELAARGASVDDTVREVTVGDVQQACDVFSGTWEHSGGVDGRVSLEVSPLLARDTEATLAEALDLWKAVDRPNLLVKIPATQEGLPAITRALAEGVSVNVTLIFSVERYREVMTAYMEGLEQAAANGQTLAGIASVASFFVSRVDTEIDKRLEKIGTDEALALRGKAGVANSRLAYAAFEEVFQGKRWAALTAQGAKPAAAAVGLDRGEEPRLLRHHVRDRADRRRHRQHDAGEDPARVRRPRRGRGRPGHRHGRAGAGGVRRPRARRRRPDRRVPHPGGRGRARSSSSRGRSCSTPSRASSTPRSEPGALTPDHGRVSASRAPGPRRSERPGVRPVTITEPARRRRPGLSRMCSGARTGA